MTTDNPESTPTLDDMDGASHEIFRWEAASGLEHTCYACTTKSNNPKAKQTCYGIHSIPCFRYHQTMHAIGTSHNCFACIQADTMHENRHRQIAELVVEVKTLEEQESASSDKNKKDFQFSLPLRERDTNMPPPPVAADANGRHRHATPARIVIPDNQAHTNGDDSENENDEHSPSSATTTTPSTTSSSTIPRLTKADTRAAKRAAKFAKSQRKSLKNQTKLAYTVSVKASDVENVATVLHGASFSDSASKNAGDAEEGARHPLASDKNIEDVIERNRRYLGHIREHRAYLLNEVGGQRKKERRERVKKQQAQQKDYRTGKARRGVHEKVEDEEAQAAEVEEKVVDAILVKFGITTTASSSATSGADGHLTTPNKRHSTSSGSGSSSSHTHSKLALIAQLRVAIAEDLQKHENEQRNTLIRAGGFWRYVGRQVFDRMCAVGEKIDWRTGTIKKGGEEGKNDDAPDEGDGGGDVAADNGDVDPAGNGEGEEGQDATPGTDVQEHKQDKAEAEKTDDTAATTALDDWNVVGRRDRRHLQRTARVVYPTINQKARGALLDEESN